MSEGTSLKKEYKSKTAVTKCGYCKIEIKEANLENHCKNIHKKPRLVAGQQTLTSMPTCKKARLSCEDDTSKIIVDDNSNSNSPK